MAGSEKLVISDLVLKLTGISKGFFSGRTYWFLVFWGQQIVTGTLLPKSHYF